ncbi:MAG: ABC transporter ATP-binding protein [Bdellovibrionaceae bacterium]|nr:ABC transporter ATP-binding protein [Pseudobdellovibrionaceae bacterium]
MFKNTLKLLPFIKPYKGEFVFILFSGFLLGLVATVPTLLIGLLANALEKKDLLQTLPQSMISLSYHFFSPEQVAIFAKNHELQLKIAAIGFPVNYLFFGFLRYQNYFRARFVSEVIGNELRVALLGRLLHLNQRFFSSLSSGSGGLISRTLNDTMLIQQSMNQYMDLLREPFVALVSIGSMFLLNYKLTLVSMIFAPVVGFVIRKISRRLRQISNESQENLDLITKSFKESIDGIRVIQSYNLESYVQDHFHKKISLYNKLRKKFAQRIEMASPINEFLTSIVICFICLFLGELSVRGEADLTSFLMFITLAANLEKPSKKIQQALVGIQQTEVSIERIFQIIENQSVVEELPMAQRKNFVKDWNTIEFQGVSFEYGTRSVLHNINLTISRGESIAIVGESGSGKSTLINLLERFIDPTAGSIFIGGVDIKNVSLKELRENITFVSQDTFLFDESVEENICLGKNDSTRDKLLLAAEKANAIRFIERSSDGFATRVGERGAHFSGGEKQRISIARAIYKNAPILIMDEATSALDTASEKEVQEGISSLLKDKTALIIAHRLSTIRHCDRILVMDNGRIVEQGTHDELIQLGKKYSHLHQLQNISSSES